MIGSSRGRSSSVDVAYSWLLEKKNMICEGGIDTLLRELDYDWLSAFSTDRAHSISALCYTIDFLKTFFALVYSRFSSIFFWFNALNEFTK